MTNHPSTERGTPVRRLARAIARAVSWHRRKLAVTAAVLAVLCGVQAATPPSAETVPVVVAAGQVAGGTVLTDEHLRVADFSPDLLPDRAVTAPEALLGRTVAAPLTEGQVLTEVSVVTASVVAEDGRVLTPVQIDAGGLAQLLAVGDAVDLVAAAPTDPMTETSAEIVARQARLVSIAAAEGAGGAFGAAEERSTSVLVEVTEDEALRLAEVGLGTAVRVILR